MIERHGLASGDARENRQFATAKDGWIPLGPQDEVSMGGSKIFKVTERVASSMVPEVAGRRLSIDPGEHLILGRTSKSAKADAESPRFELGKSSLDKTHARLGVDEKGRLFIEDIGDRGTGSKDGTYINGKRLVPNRRYYLNSEFDTVWLGKRWSDEGRELKLRERSSSGEKCYHEDHMPAKPENTVRLEPRPTSELRRSPRPVDPLLPADLTRAYKVGTDGERAIRIMGDLGKDLPHESIVLSQEELAQLGKEGSRYEKIELTVRSGGKSGEKVVYYRPVSEKGRFYVLNPDSTEGPKLIRDYEVFIEPGPSAASNKAAAVERPSLTRSKPDAVSRFTDSTPAESSGRSGTDRALPVDRTSRVPVDRPALDLPVERRLEILSEVLQQPTLKRVLEPIIRLGFLKHEKAASGLGGSSSGGDIFNDLIRLAEQQSARASEVRSALPQAEKELVDRIGRRIQVGVDAFQYVDRQESFLNERLFEANKILSRKQISANDKEYFEGRKQALLDEMNRLRLAERQTIEVEVRDIVSGDSPDALSKLSTRYEREIRLAKLKSEELQRKIEQPEITVRERARLECQLEILSARSSSEYPALLKQCNEAIRFLGPSHSFAGDMKALYIADGFMPPGEYKYHSPQHPKLKDLTIEIGKGELVSKAMVDAVVGELVATHEKFGQHPQKLKLKSNLAGDVKGEYRNFEITIADGTAEATKSFFLHETGHLIDDARLRQAALSPRTEKVWSDAVLKAREVICRHAKVTDPILKDFYISRLLMVPQFPGEVKTAEEWTHYLASRNEMVAELFFVYKKGLEMAEKNSKSPTFTEILAAMRIENPEHHGNLRFLPHFETLYDHLKSEVFEPLAIEQLVESRLMSDSPGKVRRQLVEALKAGKNPFSRAFVEIISQQTDTIDKVIKETIFCKRHGLNYGSSFDPKKLSSEMQTKYDAFVKDMPLVSREVANQLFCKRFGIPTEELFDPAKLPDELR
ncbi:MAG: FHA domain-containing protein, partial [Cyanobacteria bacterium]|nr:FHA domain-containing protein [Cyanobacteriota bacterium]